jgi:menaquinone-specific isochorismate synthase
MDSSFFNCGSIIRLDAEKYLTGWGKRTWYKEYQVSAAPFFYFPDFFLSLSYPWFQHENHAIVNYEDLISLFTFEQSENRLSWKDPSFRNFKETFEEIKTLFSQGILKKAVPYIFEETENPFRLKPALEKILKYTYDQKLHVYGFWDEKEGLLGASPEILFNLKKHAENAKSFILETIACAGTKSNHVSQEHFLHDAKEIFEHQLVVEGIRESLAPFGQVELGARQILKLPRLSHLITPIKALINESINFTSIVEAMHPTPALGAFPREPGKLWLTAYQQKMPRERYGAPAGCILKKGNYAKCIVGIRNIQWSLHKARIGAGCGVVADSQPDHEWQEIKLKLSSIKEMLSV